MLKTALFLTFSVFLLILCPFTANGQDSARATPWKQGGSVGLNFNQAGLKNWAGGGENSVAFSGLVRLFRNYKRAGVSWDNSLDLGYGLTKVGEQGLRKSDDKLVAVTKYGRKFVRHWSVSGLVDFRTQFSTGYDYKQTPKQAVSKFMSPGYVTLALGAEYKPSADFSVLISPVTGKTTFVLDDSLSDRGLYGVKPGDNFKQELGASVNARYKLPLMKNITFETKLGLFTSYSDPFVDVNWESTFIMKVNKYFSTTFSTHLIYDDDIRDKKGDVELQFKEVLAVGVLINF